MFPFYNSTLKAPGCRIIVALSQVQYEGTTIHCLVPNMIYSYGAHRAQIGPRQVTTTVTTEVKSTVQPCML